jgi:hypothetical protein
VQYSIFVEILEEEDSCGEDEGEDDELGEEGGAEHPDHQAPDGLVLTTHHHTKTRRR